MNLAYSRRMLLSLATLLLVIGLGLPTQVTYALAGATFTVNSNSDADNASDGVCTLREAIWAAVNDFDYHECVHTGASFGDDSIAFALSGSTTITLSSNLPGVASGPLTIDGLNSNGAYITVDGASSYVPFYITSSGSLTLRNIIVQHGFGSVGGGVSNTGTLNVFNSTFLNNAASSEGGAIENFGGPSMTIVNSTFFGNSAPYGGAVSINGGAGTILNSTLSGNSASTHGAELSTWASAVTTVRNTILANSTGSEDCWNGAGNTLAGDHNIIETTASPDCSSITTSTADPMLGALSSSPPFYFSLNAGSPAVDTGNDAVCAAAPVNNTSQNGFRRPQGAHCDIGSTESAVTVIFRSSGAQDGWVLETSENSNVGGTLSATPTTLRLGDDATRKQYRSILSFATGSLPDTAILGKVLLLLRKSSVTGAGDPVSAFHGFMLDLKTGTFGTAALQTGDFQTAGTASYGPFLPTLSGGWYSITLLGVRTHSINKLASGGGLTQIRLRFRLDDNNNALANYLSLFSGNAPAASRPQLVIQYYVP